MIERCLAAMPNRLKQATTAALADYRHPGHIARGACAQGQSARHRGELVPTAHPGCRSSSASLCLFNLVYSRHMPEAEPQSPMPAWAERERISDLAWIVENLHIFWPAAEEGYIAHGRGALVVDTTIRPTDAGHPFGYFPQEDIEIAGGDDERRMVAQYDPDHEMVTVLLKAHDRCSTYRIGVPGRPDR
jgi:hypothetical protein